MFDRLRYGIRNTWQVLYIYTLMRLGVYKSTPKVKEKLEVNTTVSFGTKLSKELSEGMTRCANPPFRLNLEQRDILQHPVGKVWIYNVSSEQHMGSLSSAYLKDVKLVPREDGEEYTVVTSLPLVITVPKHNPDTNEINYFYEDGRRVAQDLINPNNLGIDQCKADLGYLSKYSSQNDYSFRGLFWSTKNPPSKRDIAVAKKKLKQYYTIQLEKYEAIRVASLEGMMTKNGLVADTILTAQKIMHKK